MVIQAQVEEDVDMAVYVNDIDNEILVGSYYFFKDYDDYKPKDYDYIVICDKERSTATTERRVCSFNTRKEKCYTFCSTKEEFIDRFKKCDNVSVNFGKFLIPEFANKIGLTIEDLKGLKKYVDLLDDKHSYQKIIYNAYMKNNDFVLTDNQRKRAYTAYKNARKEIYEKITE